MSAERLGTVAPLRITVSGASGFVGRHLVAALAADGHRVTALVRRAGAAFPPGVTTLVGPLDALDERRLPPTDVFVHLAALAQGGSTLPRERYRRVNTELTLSLAELCRRCGVSRFVFLSSAKVHGEGGAVPIGSDSPYDPQDFYAESKVAAERALAELGGSAGSGGAMRTLALRPPLVYGHGAGGNVRRIVAACAARRPLPLPSRANRRSFLGVGNLCAAIGACAAAGGPPSGFAGYVLDDGEPISTERFVEEIGRALGRRARVVRVPTAAMRLAERWAGRAGVAISLRPLYADFVLENAAITAATGWRPTIALATGIEAMLERSKGRPS